MTIETALTFLFVPGDRPERFEKAMTAGADVVIYDLEDSVPEHNKRQALRNITAWLDQGNTGVVRTNSVHARTWSAEVRELSRFSRNLVLMLPKATFASLQEASLSFEGTFIPLIETARGVLQAEAISETRGVRRIALGTIDLSVELDVDPKNEKALQGIRSRLVLASAAAEIPSPIDGVATDLADRNLDEECRMARGLGMGAKMCIHPRQVGPVARAFRPTMEEVRWAQTVVSQSTDGVSVIEGEMVDLPVIQRARRILSRADSGDGGCGDAAS